MMNEAIVRNSDKVRYYDNMIWPIFAGKEISNFSIRATATIRG